MNNNDKNKNISNNYKDYKYVYTGYDDFIKEHHLDKKEIKEEKEKIIHDHRNVFDFNNPNQHTHDYSFDFSQEEPTTKKQEKTYKDRYGNIYNQKTTTTTYNNTNKTTTTTSYNSSSYYNKTNDKTAKTAKNIILLIFFLPFVLTILTSIIPLFVYMFESDYSETAPITTTTSISTIKRDLCDAVENNNFSLINSYLPEKEMSYYNAITWKKVIENQDYYGNPNYAERRVCEVVTGYYLDDSSISSLKNEYSRKYYNYPEIVDAYSFEILVTGSSSKKYVVTAILIDNDWELFKIN